MTQLFLVRHGPTHAKSFVGWTDLPADLSDTAAISRLHDYLPTEAVVISSDLSRAVATADAIQGKRIRLAHDPDLREIHFGAWEMQHFSEIEDQDHLRSYWETPGDVRAPDGESWHDVVTRVNDAIARLITSHAGCNIILVAHFGVILTQVQRAGGLSAYEAFGHKIDNLSVTEVSLTSDGWQSGCINHIP